MYSFYTFSIVLIYSIDVICTYWSKNCMQIDLSTVLQNVKNSKDSAQLINSFQV